MSNSEELETETYPELIPELRKVNLIGFKEIYPYKDANIEIADLDISAIRPSAFYVLEENLKRVYFMYRNLERQNIDIFNLDKIITFEGFNLCAPIIEIQNGENVIVDGLHRIFMAKLLWRKSIKVILVSNVTTPLAVMPLNWSDVNIHINTPNIKRIYNPEIEEGKHSLFYRDFSNLGSTGERKVSYPK